MSLEQVAEQPFPPSVELSADGRPSDVLLPVDADGDVPGETVARALTRLRDSRRVVVAVSRYGAARREIVEAADVYLSGARDPSPAAVTFDDVARGLARVESTVAGHGVAALTLAWLLRGSAGVPVPEALAMESSAYSALLAGAEFRAWLAARREARSADPAPRVEITRAGGTLSIRLNRPARRNAVDAAMRDELLAALSIAEADPALRVVVSGAGPSFSAGGDLDEFGDAQDVARAHVLRVSASVGAALWRLADRVTVKVHGACLGAGAELPAFAGRVVADPATEFGLPEVGMGLIPGAGGTVSIPRRIGRHRTLWLALTAERLSAGRALDWGLVDAVE